MKRSVWMLDIAKKASKNPYAKKGIWKIGNIHVRDIQSMDECDDYNLIDQKDFKLTNPEETDRTSLSVEF